MHWKLRISKQTRIRNLPIGNESDGNKMFLRFISSFNFAVQMFIIMFSAVGFYFWWAQVYATWKTYILNKNDAKNKQ